MKRTIKGIRYDAGLTQSEMAKKLGISEATYINYENGKSKIPYKVAIMICDICNIDNPRNINFN